MAILVTGGAGYIGSHTDIELLESGYDVVIIDNLSNSKLEAINRINEISKKKLTFYEGDVLDKEILRLIFQENDIEAVIHFAGYKAVGESVAQPIKYYHNNIGSTLALIEVMNEFNVKKLVFSSSATVYSVDNKSPLTEDMSLGAVNPYGKTKYMIEEILRDLIIADSSWSISILRYFNPIGAHKSGLIGEDPKGIPNNLMPFITQVAIGKLDELTIFGDDYDTEDGTGVRDYIHVVDLAKGHIKALEKIKVSKGLSEYNLGTGEGYSVLDVVNNFEKANGIKIPYTISKRRPGDIATSYADASKALYELGWKAEKSLFEMCKDSWNWQKNNPEGLK